MAGGRRGAADRVLESRHLVGLFLGVVLLCGVFFTLGYVMGKTQFGGPVQASESTPRSLAAERKSDAEVASNRRDRGSDSSHAAPAASDPRAAAPSSNEWDFYTEKKSEHPATEPRNSAPAPVVPVAPARSAEPAPKTIPAAARFQAPRLVKGSIVLQIAALTRQGDALAMADELQQKRFPAFVVTPTGDNFYRVQVGPYADEHAADAAKANLDRAGFKAITKR